MQSVPASAEVGYRLVDLDPVFLNLDKCYSQGDGLLVFVGKLCIVMISSISNDDIELICSSKFFGKLYGKL